MHFLFFSDVVTVVGVFTNNFAVVGVFFTVVGVFTNNHLDVVGIFTNDYLDLPGINTFGFSTPTAVVIITSNLSYCC